MKRIGLFLSALLIAGCVSAPVKDLWPPKPDEALYEVDVVNYDNLHSALAVYPADYDGSQRVREYSFGEKNWYMDMHRSMLDGLKALLLPNASVMEITDLEPQEFRKKLGWAKRIWRFYVTREGRERMLRALGGWYDETRLLAEKNGAKYYAGKKSYHFFRACHHVTAGALRAGGLPLTPWWAFTEGLIAIQLTRAEKSMATFTHRGENCK